MQPPKYKFYVGRRIKAKISNNVMLDDEGHYHRFDAPVVNESVAEMMELPKNQLLYFDLNKTKHGLPDIEPDNVSKVYFYDKDKNFIKSELISANVVCQPPKEAAYFGARYCTRWFEGADVRYRIPFDEWAICFVYRVTPHFSSLTKKYAKESNQQFFRQSLDGRINLFGYDANIVINGNIEDKFVFIVSKQNYTSKDWYQYYSGEFSKTDCILDTMKRSCELKLTPLDDYTKVLAAYDNTYDLFKLSLPITFDTQFIRTPKVTIHQRPVIQFYVPGGNTVSNFFGGTYWEEDVNEVVDNYHLKELHEKYHFNTIYCHIEFDVVNAPDEHMNGHYGGMYALRKQISGNNPNILPGGDGTYEFTIGTWDAVNPSERVIDLRLRDAKTKQVIYINSGERDDGHTNNVKGATTAFDYVWDGIEESETEIFGYQGEDRAPDYSKSLQLVNIKTQFISSRLLIGIPEIGGQKAYDLPLEDMCVNRGNYKYCIDPQRETVLFKLLASDYAVKVQTKYGQNDYEKYFSNLFNLPNNDIRLFPVCRNAWVNTAFWLTYNYDNWFLFEQTATNDFILEDGYPIEYVIAKLLYKIDPSITHEGTEEYSKFLYGNTMPLTYLNASFRVYITQKTNILKGDYDEAAKKAETSLKEIMEMLRDHFQLYWFIENKQFKIEHISYFLNGRNYNPNLQQIEIDLKDKLDILNKKQILYFQSELQYDKASLYKRLEFKSNEDCTELFDSINMDINSNYVQQDKTEEINSGKFTADVDLMLLFPEKFSDDGFALLCPVEMNNEMSLPLIRLYNLIDKEEDDKILRWQAKPQNYYASWAFLHRTYLSNLSALNYSVELLDIEAQASMFQMGIMKCMQHVVQFPYAEDASPMKLISTQYGNGLVDSISVDLDTRQHKITLGYEPS